MNPLYLHKDSVPIIEAGLLHHQVFKMQGFL